MIQLPTLGAASEHPRGARTGYTANSDTKDGDLEYRLIMLLRTRLPSKIPMPRENSTVTTLTITSTETKVTERGATRTTYTSIKQTEIQSPRKKEHKQRTSGTEPPTVSVR
jgi:hypothetical protein